MSREASLHHPLLPSKLAGSPGYPERKSNRNSHCPTGEMLARHLRTVVGSEFRNACGVVCGEVCVALAGVARGN